MTRSSSDPVSRPCCSPDRGGRAPVATPLPTTPVPATPVSDAPPDVAPPIPSGPDAREGAVRIPGGTALVGTRTAQIENDGESPLRKARVAPFLIGATTVTNAQFAAFVTTTGYVTEAERFGWSFVFWMQAPDHMRGTVGQEGVKWWRQVHGATWRAPNGPGSEDQCLPDHPVVQVSWNDARAYAAWVGGRLPSEAEWEHAARGGLGDVRFPWGDQEPDDHDFTPCNIWQGAFPHQNTARDGYLTTAPAHAFAPNGYGLYNMVGNVWEWTAQPFHIKSLKTSIKARLAAGKGNKLMKGGSFLCHRSYCYRYRIAARNETSPDTATTHQGFRVVWDDRPGACARSEGRGDRGAP